MKKFVAILLVMLLAVAFVACDKEASDPTSVTDYGAASTTQKLENGKVDFEIYTGDSIKITNYTGIFTLHSVTIPESIIPEGANKPFTVEVIGTGAFRSCTALQSVTIPNTVTTIEDYAFAGCENLEEITIPASVTTIGPKAFYACTSLKTVKFADGSAIKTISDNAFNDCIALESINLPEGLQNIGIQAFRDCSALTSIKTPASLESIGNMAFYGCEALNAQGAVDLSASVNITVTTETITDEATGAETVVETVAIGEFVFGNINKNYIIVPTDADSAIAKYVAAMTEPEEEETTESDTATDETTGEATGDNAHEAA